MSAHIRGSVSNSRARLRERWPNAGERRQRIAAALVPGGFLDPLGPYNDDDLVWQYTLIAEGKPASSLERIRLVSPDPDDLTLRQARLLANADRVFHRADVPAAILDRARADATRIACAAAPAEPGSGLVIDVEMA